MSGEVISNFDYAPLEPQVQRVVKDAAEEIRRGRDQHLDGALQMGRALISVKKALPHGEFGKWLKAEFGWAERTAQRLMSVAETFGENPTRVSDLSLRVVYLLSSRSTPEAARDVVLERMDQGERPTEEEVVSLVKQKQYELKEKAAAVAEEAAKKAKKAKKTPEGVERERLQAEKRNKRFAAEERRIKAENEKRIATAREAVEFIRGRLGDDFEVLLRLLEETDSRLFQAELQRALEEPRT
jgi:hypothetical protein